MASSGNQKNCRKIYSQSITSMSNDEDKPSEIIQMC